MGGRGNKGADNVVEPVDQWRGMQAAVERLGLQPVGDLTNIGRGKHTTRHVSLLEVSLPDFPAHCTVKGVSHRSFISCMHH